MKNISFLILVSCILAVLVGCEPNPMIPPLILKTDPSPLVIDPDTWTVTFYGTNFAGIELEEPPYYTTPYLNIQGPGFNYYCTGDEYYSHACPYALYVYYTFDEPSLYEILSDLAPPPYTGSFRVFNVGQDLENNAGGGDDKPSNVVSFTIN